MSIWAMKNGDSVATEFTQDAAGLALAKTYVDASPPGVIQIGPGADGAFAYGAGWTNIALVQSITGGGVVKHLFARLHAADFTDPTKRAFFDPSAIATGTIRSVGLPDWSGLVPLPVDAGTLGLFLKSNGSGSAPTWAAVSITNALLDGANHTDTVAQAVARGALVIGNSTPKWDRLAIGGANTVLFSNGTDPSWVAASTIAALTQHDLLLHLKPITVTNCSWTTGTATITHASGGFADVKVGDYVGLGDVTGTNNAGRRVTVWNSSNSLTVDATNGNATLTNQTFTFFSGDHYGATTVIDSVGTGGGYLMTNSTGTYATGGAGATYQELRGPMRWMPHASGSVQSDFDVIGSQSTVTLSGFCIRRQGTAFRAYFYPGALTADRFFSFPNSSGILLTDLSVANVLTKTLTTGNKIEMDGTATYTVFTLPAAGGDRLGFSFSAMTALRVASWQDRAGTVAYLDDLLTSGVYAPGSTTLADGSYRVHVKQLRLTSTQRLTMAGDSRLVLMN